MISAIFEILFLLIVSCLIGVFFTYRYWKAKYLELVAENAKLNNELADASTKKANAETKVRELESAILKSERENEALREAAKSKAGSGAETIAQVDPKELDKLNEQIEILQEQMGEKEREIEMLSKELDKKKISYYKQIDGKRYKAITINMADQSVSGQGDGRISKEDAEKIFATISDGKAYTQVEKDTMHYLRTNYKWTEGADQLFRTKVRSWAAKGHELN